MRMLWRPGAITSYDRHHCQRRCWSRGHRIQHAASLAARQRLAINAVVPKPPRCIASCASIARRCSPRPPRAVHQVAAIRDSWSRNSTNTSAAASSLTAWSVGTQPGFVLIAWKVSALVQVASNQPRIVRLDLPCGAGLLALSFCTMLSVLNARLDTTARPEILTVQRSQSI
jgi:hypothetical protein